TSGLPAVPVTDQKPEHNHGRHGMSRQSRNDGSAFSVIRKNGRLSRSDSYSVSKNISRNLFQNLLRKILIPLGTSSRDENNIAFFRSFLHRLPYLPFF